MAVWIELLFTQQFRNRNIIHQNSGVLSLRLERNSIRRHIKHQLILPILKIMDHNVGTRIRMDQERVATLPVIINF